MPLIAQRELFGVILFHIFCNAFLQIYYLICETQMSYRFNDKFAHLLYGNK